MIRQTMRRRDFTIPKPFLPVAGLLLALVGMVTIVGVTIAWGWPPIDVHANLHATAFVIMALGIGLFVGFCHGIDRDKPRE